MPIISGRVLWWSSLLLSNRLWVRLLLFRRIDSYRGMSVYLGIESLGKENCLLA